MPTARAIAKYHDFLIYVLLSAPDRFPDEDYLQPHEQMDLAKAFARLLGELPSLHARVKDEGNMLVLKELLFMAQESYAGGNEIRGAHILQEFEGLIWPKYKKEERYALEAVARVLGARNE